VLKDQSCCQRDQLHLLPATENLNSADFDCKVRCTAAWSLVLCYPGTVFSAHQSPLPSACRDHTFIYRIASRRLAASGVPAAGKCFCTSEDKRPQPRRLLFLHLVAPVPDVAKKITSKVAPVPGV